MKSIIIFDGECNFCNFYINKLISVDKDSKFLFTPYNSEKAKELLDRYNIPSTYRESFILSDDEKHFEKSGAVIEILRRLGSYWKILGLMSIVIPRFLRDMIYDIVARNRYKISERYNTCIIPTPDMISRFV